MNQPDQKPFVVIGSQEVKPEVLMELYGLTLEECYLGMVNDPASYLAVGKVIQLHIRSEGDYKDHLDKILKENWDLTGGEDVKKARKKTKFKTNVPWYNALKKKGKG